MANANATRNATRNKGDKAASAARKAAAQNATAREAIEGGDAIEGIEATEGNLSQFARELARAEAGESKKADNRFIKLAGYFADKIEGAKPGAVVTVRLADVGAKTGAQRSTVGSWATLLQRFGQYNRTVGQPMPYSLRLDRETQTVAVTVAAD
jgi:hypothetical protein